MPPRYAYWTIIAGGLPTAFRAASRDELLPTFHRIQAKHPDAVMKWFARGKIWDSEEAARREWDAHRSTGRSGAGGKQDRPRGRREGGDGSPGPARKPGRPRDWRPGGDHRDPRQPFADAKRERNQRQRAARFAHKNRPTTGRPPRSSESAPARPPRRRQPPRGGRGPRRS